MSNPVTGPWSSGSYGFAGLMKGEIFSINDPLNSNRVQVRIEGYQHDKGTIPDDKLPWIRVMGHDSQLKGAGSTHNYYPKAKVLVTMVGTEMLVIGATGGFDSATRGDEPDTGNSKEPDMPKQAQGQGKTLAKASSGTGDDKFNHELDPKTDKRFSKPKEKDAYDDAKQKAPFDKGKPAKFPDLKSIGIDKLVHGEDVLEKIKGMDGNASGAVKAALDIIKNLRKNGFGTSKDTIGSGPISQAANQFASDFGAQPAIDILALLKELAACYRILRDATKLTIRPLILDGTGTRILSSLRPTIFNVGQDVTDRMYQDTVNIAASTTQDPTVYLEALRSDFMNGVLQAVSAVAEYLNDLAAQAGSAGAFIAMFKDPQNFCDLCNELAALGQQIGIDPNSFKPVGMGAVGTALNSGVTGVAQASAGQGGGGGSGQNPIQQITAALNMFQNNPIALGEMKSGQIDPTSLLKIPLKYAKKKINDPQKMFSTLFK